LTAPSGYGTIPWFSGMTADVLVHLAGVRKTYGAVLVLDDITLDVRAGEAVALLGANGAGKTTLLKIAATLVRPSRGRVVVAGHDCLREAEAARRHLGLVAHGSHLYEDLTARENLRFWTVLGGHAADRSRLDEALAAVELDTVGDERVRTFSAGMKRRLTLARFALVPPRVLLLDEPSAGLDQRGRKWLEAFLQAFKGGGGAIVMATHSFGRELGVADRIVILADGRIALDTARASLSADDVQRLYALHAEGDA
jgi:heme ABC exporter ATP-binding subunit CcmA